LSTSRSEVARARAQQRGHVTHGDAHAPVAQQVRGERAAVPPDDRRHQLRYHHLRARPQRVERGAQREAHAEPAHQHARRLVRREVPAAEARQRLLRAVHAARHQALAVGVDHELAVAPGEDQALALGRPRLAEQLPRLHRAYDIGGPPSGAREARRDDVAQPDLEGAER
jgi:hypothetical protein